MTCPYTGCNMPESECLGNCLHVQKAVKFYRDTTMPFPGVIRSQADFKWDASNAPRYGLSYRTALLNWWRKVMS